MPVPFLKIFGPKKEAINHHFVLIEAPESIIGPEMITWGEAQWWPKGSRMRFKRLSALPIQIGTEYQQKVMAPVGGRHWRSRVTKLTPGHEIERTFMDGMFQGRESVTIEGRYNGTKVDYKMVFKVRGISNKIFWPLIFRRMHDANIRLILAALKKYCELKNSQAEGTS